MALIPLVVASPGVLNRHPEACPPSQSCCILMAGSRGGGTGGGGGWGTLFLKAF